MTYRQSIKAAKTDAALRRIALAIRASNRARVPCPELYAAFAERGEALALRIPPGYLSHFVVVAILAA